MLASLLKISAQFQLLKNTRIAVIGRQLVKLLRLLPTQIASEFKAQGVAAKALNFVSNVTQ
jgi:hypothetical protein